jgi:hypothetical protein
MSALKGVHTYAMPSGAMLYHGTTSTGFDVPRGPAWVTDERHTAKEATHWREDQRGQRGRILKLRTIRTLHLLDISTSRGIPLSVIKHYFGPRPGDRGTSRIPPEVLKTEGISSYELARALCNEGKYDGWICDIGCLWADARGADILICRPETSLKRVL